MDNIAIVPASMLPLTETLKEKVNTLPKGGVFLCYAEENTRQRKLLKHVEETFRRQGHAVRGYLRKAGQLEYDCRYSTMHGMPVTGGRGFRGLKPLWYNGVPP